MPTSTSQLQRVRDLIKSGKRKEAVATLAGLIEREHENPELWWLLANATENPTQARAALDQMLSLKPGDERALKLMRRLEARQLLRQMGVNQKESRSPNRRPLLLMTGATAGVVVLLIAGVALSRLQRPGNDDLPTLMPTQAAYTTDIPTAVKTDEPVILPETTTDLSGQPLVAATTEPTTVPTIEPTQVPPTAAATEAIVTVETVPPTEATLNPESTDEARAAETLALNPPSVDTPIPAPGSESTSEPGPVIPGTTTANVPGSETSALSALPTDAVTDMRGQVLDGVVRRDLIKPYGVQGWTFSGYRNEHIHLELVNVTGDGNPSLELRDESGKPIATDIDVTSGNNTDSVLDLMLPNDGVYTVVVRMAAVAEQLYELKLTRPQ